MQYFIQIRSSLPSDIYQCLVQLKISTEIGAFCLQEVCNPVSSNDFRLCLYQTKLILNGLHFKVDE